MNKHVRCGCNLKIVMIQLKTWHKTKHVWCCPLGNRNLSTRTTGMVKGQNMIICDNVLNSLSRCRHNSNQIKVIEILVVFVWTRVNVNFTKNKLNISNFGWLVKTYFHFKRCFLHNFYMIINISSSNSSFSYLKSS